MTEQRPITPPPPELVEEWYDAIDNSSTSWKQELATKAARWGADQELEACCEWVENECPGYGGPYEKLRAARRPKPPSLAEEALEAMRSMQIEPCRINGIIVNAELTSKYALIRRALERLQELENND